MKNMKIYIGILAILTVLSFATSVSADSVAIAEADAIAWNGGSANALSEADAIAWNGGSSNAYADTEAIAWDRGSADAYAVALSSNDEGYTDTGASALGNAIVSACANAWNEGSKPPCPIEIIPQEQ